MPWKWQYDSSDILKKVLEFYLPCHHDKDVSDIGSDVTQRQVTDMPLKLLCQLESSADDRAVKVMLSCDSMTALGLPVVPEV